MSLARDCKLPERYFFGETEEAAVKEEAERVHRRENHPADYDGPCWGPTAAEFTRARMAVRARQAKEAGQYAELVSSSPGSLSARHSHTCVARACRAAYECEQRCDPGSLDDSICPSCFGEAARP